jgi:HEAT repeat protein
MRPPYERLHDELGDARWATRCRAIRGLAQLGDERAVGPLSRALGDRSAAVRRAAARALGKWRDRSSMGPLIAALDDADGETRHEAASTLARFGISALGPLIAAYKCGTPVMRRAAIGVVEEIHTPAVAELLLAALGDPDRPLRMLALGALVRRKDERAVVPLIAGLDEPGAWREVCAWALGEIGDPAAFVPLCARLITNNSTFQMTVVKALRTIDNARAVDLLHALIEDDDDPGRDRLLRTLAALDLIGAIGSLCRKVKQGRLDPERVRLALSTVHDEANRSLRAHDVRTSFPIHPHESSAYENEGGDHGDGDGDPVAKDVARGEDRAAFRRSAAAMRRLEENLRELARDE